MRKWLLSGIFLLCYSISFAQDEPANDVVHWGSVTELQTVNPAYAGEQDAMVFDSKLSLHRTNAPANPLNFKLSFDSNLEKFHSGVGLNIAYNGFGFRNFRMANISWNLKIPLSEVEIHHLRIGLTAGAFQNSIFMAREDLIYPRTAGSDLFEIFVTESYFVPDLRLGAWYRNKHFFAGLVIRNIIPLNINRLSGIRNGGKEWLLPEITLNAGYAIALGDNFHLLPQLNLRCHQIGVYWEPLVRAIVANRGMFGAGISNNRLHFEGGIRFLRFIRLHYAYSHWYRGLTISNTGTHSLGIKVGIY